MENDRYFEDLVGGKIIETKTDAETDTETETAETADMGNFEIELAKANTGAVATRTSTAKTHGTAAAAKEEAWDDGEAEGQLTVDVYQTPEDIVVESAVAGVKPDNIDVTVTNDSISIRGVRRHEKEVDDNDYLYQECYWGRFARSIILPQEVDPERAEVTFKNGILTVRLPKADKKRSKKLKVRLD